MPEDQQAAASGGAGLPRVGRRLRTWWGGVATRWREAPGLRRAAVVAAAVVGTLTLLAGALWIAPPALAVRVVEPLLGAYGGFPDLPDELERPAERSVIYDAEGGELATLYRDERRVTVELEDVPQVLRDAVLATEDHEFADHPGIHHRAIARAAWANWRADEVVEGGSTITQQLVKNALVGDEETLRRKAAEAYLAIRLERRMSKSAILERYLNQVYLGEGAYGVGTAAELYFSKDVTELELAEAALLAGMLRAPEGANPLTDEEEARQRRDVVLAQMAEHGFVGESEAQAAADEEIELAVSRPEPPEEPFFVSAVVEELLGEERLGATEEDRRAALYTGGLEIHTTLDPRLQAEATDALTSVLDDPEEHPQATVVAVEPGDGAVAALAVGPREWGDCDDAEDQQDCPRTNVNPAVPGLGGSGRQPGSAFKPFAVAAALEAGVGTGWEATGDSEEPVPGCDDPDADGDWEPRNFAEDDAGIIAMDEAVADSNNVYHAKLGSLVGPDAMAEAAARAGLRSGQLDEHCALALGSGSVYPVEMGAAYATFAAGGERCAPYFVAEVNAPGGDALVREPSCEDALDPEVADTVTGLLEGVVADGTGTRAAIDAAPVAGKTGTAQDFRDAWFAGYTAGEGSLAAAVWIGHEQPVPLEDVAGEDTVTGGSLPAEMFARFMEAAVAERETGELADAAEAESVPVSDVTGQDIDEVLGEAREVPSAGDPSTLLDDELDLIDEDPEHYATGRFDLHIVVYEVSDWRPAGEVVWQSEDSGEVPAGSIVALAVSDGEGDRPEVPDVEGLDVEEAVAALEDADYEVETEDRDVDMEVAPRDPEAFVRAQPDPEAAAAGDLPDDAIPAPATLDDLDPQFEVVEEPRADGRTVIEQDPAPGESLEPGETVSLEVARLVTTLRLPDVELDDDGDGDDDGGDDDDDDGDDDDDDGDDDDGDDDDGDGDDDDGDDDDDDGDDDDGGDGGDGGDNDGGDGGDDGGDDDNDGDD